MKKPITDYNGKNINIGDIVEVKYYSFFECICSCIYEYTKDETFKLIEGTEPESYFSKQYLLMDNVL